MTAAVCPICASPVATHPNPRARIDAPVTWSAWCHSWRKMHTKATKIIGTGMTEEEAIQSLNAKSVKYAARLEKREACKAFDHVRRAHEEEQRQRDLVKRAEQRRNKRARERVEIAAKLKGIHPDCPSCGVPLRVGERMEHDDEGRHTGETYFAAWCPERFYGCKFRPRAEIRGTSPEEAMGRWLRLDNRRAPMRVKKDLTVWDTRTGTCSCGASLYGNQTNCGGFHLTIHEHARSGLEAGAFNFGR